IIPCAHENGNPADESWEDDDQAWFFNQAPSFPHVGKIRERRSPEPQRGYYGDYYGPNRPYYGPPSGGFFYFPPPGFYGGFYRGRRPGYYGSGRGPNPGYDNYPPGGPPPGRPPTGGPPPGGPPTSGPPTGGPPPPPPPPPGGYRPMASAKSDSQASVQITTTTTGIV
ncbi:unnamed protein product, partial [Allacma fusca]